MKTFSIIRGKMIVNGEVIGRISKITGCLNKFLGWGFEYRGKFYWKKYIKPQDAYDAMVAKAKKEFGEMFYEETKMQ